MAIKTCKPYNWKQKFFTIVKYEVSDVMVKDYFWKKPEKKEIVIANVQKNKR